jgi:hypothetical protein
VLVSSATAFVGPALGGLSAARHGLLSAGTCRQRDIPQAARRLPTPVYLRMQGGIAADEDDWYDSEKWESFRKSGARQSGPLPNAKDASADSSSRDATSDKMSNDVQSQQRDGQKRQGANPAVEWMRIAGCDVCLPKDRKRPIDGSQRFTGLVHFIGGAFVGTLPRQSYTVLIESLVAKGRLIVVATPCSGLAGMDHYKAAYEATFKFQTGCMTPVPVCLCRYLSCLCLCPRQYRWLCLHQMTLDTTFNTHTHSVQRAAHRFRRRRLQRRQASHYRYVGCKNVLHVISHCL